jgi:hypothetical protein
MYTNNNNILRDANQLRQTATQKKQIAMAVREVLLHLNDAILREHELGNGSVQDYLPMQFPIDGMSFLKMQQLVWCEVISLLEEKNYRVKIEPCETECVIHIKWESDEEKEKSKQQLQILADHTIKN